MIWRTKNLIITKTSDNLFLFYFIFYTNNYNIQLYLIKEVKVTE